MEVDLSGRTVVVTGGTRGIGRAAVDTLARSGAAVYFQGRDKAAAQAVVASCASAAVAPTFVPGDLHSYADLETLVDSAIQGTGTLSGLVASGGSRLPRPSVFIETKPDELGDYFPTRGLQRIQAAHVAARRMKNFGYGKILLLTSDAGRVPTPSESLVGAACASVIFFVRAAARELVGDGIRINALAVSLTEDTPSHDNWKAKSSAGSDETIVKAFTRLAERAPFGLSTAPEVAELAALFLAAETDGVSGATLSINRGTYFPSY